MLRRASLLAVAVAILVPACGGNDGPPPPPPATGANTCATLKSCGLDTSGVSCDDTTATACNQCVVVHSCADLAAQACSPPCATFKKK